MSGLSGWHDPDVPAQQADCAMREREAWLGGAAHGPFDAFRDLVRIVLTASRNPTVSLLEIGCGAGYYADVVNDINSAFPVSGVILNYTGCDSSAAMVEYTNLHHELSAFRCDQRELSWPDGSFDVVMSGSCLLHIPPEEWPAALAEARRISRRWVLLHRTPILAGAGAEWEHVTKPAYGVEIEEWHVPNEVLRKMAAAAGLLRMDGRRWSYTATGWQESALYRLDA